MQQFYVVILDNVLEYCALWYFYYSVCGIKSIKKAWQLLFHGVTILGFIWLSLSIDSYVLKCLAYAVMGMLPAVMFNNKLYVKCGISLLESIIQFVSELLIVAILSQIYDFEHLPLSVALYSMSVVYARLAGLAVTVLLSKILAKRLKFHYKASLGKLILLLLLTVAGFFVLNTLFYGLMEQRDRFWAFFISICMVCTIFIYVLFNEFEMQEQKIIKQKYAYMEELQRIQEDNWKRINDKNDKLRLLTHDTKNFLLLIHGYIIQGDIRKAQLKLEEQLKELKQAQSINSGVLMLDTVISAKEAVAKNERIKFRCSILLNDIINIDPIDLAMAVANALDNAIEAARKIEEAKRSIILEIKMIGGYIHILIENTVAEAVIIRNNHIETTKEDKELHGFGIKSIQAIAEKYDGEVILQYKEKVFYTSIILKNEGV